MGGNANSGRRPQATAIRMLRGNPSKVKPNPDEPQPPRADPSFDEPPPELQDVPDALAEWARVVPILRVCGMITNAERSILIALCLEWAKYLQGGRDIATDGMILERASGAPMINPAFVATHQALTQCRHLWMELGMTPSGRAKLTALPQSPAPSKPGKWAGQL